MDAVFFPSLAELRGWLEAHGERAAELWVGFYKTATGRPSITWPQAVDEALCFGWIDGMCKRIDDTAYEATFRANAEAWAFFAAQAPSYRKVATFWVMSAQREKTRQKRLATQIKDSAAGRRIRQVTYTPKTKG